MQLYYIRHAQSQNNALYEETGSDAERNSDPEITEKGRQQAQNLADFIASAGPGASDGRNDPHNRLGFGLTHVYCSLMVRSIQTGRFLSSRLGLPLEALSDLHEGGGIFLKNQSSGELVGMPGNNLAYFQDHYPDLVLPGDMNPDGWWNRPFEDYGQRPARAARMLKLILSLHADSDDRVALISHGGFYNYFLSQVLGIPERTIVETDTLSSGAWLSLHNTGITRIDFLPRERRLVYHNRVDFLPSDLIT